MDGAPQGPSDLDGVLTFLERMNRWAGGSAVVLRYLGAWRPRWDPATAVRILDVGTGAADIPVAIVGWARRHGVRVEVTALEAVPRVAEIARQRVRSIPQITVLAGDLFELARGARRFDYVTASLFLHHVDPPHALAAVRALDRLTLRGLVVSDLRRTWPALLGVSIASFMLGNHVVRHDGPLSVRRAFRPAELQALAQDAEAPYLRARNEPWFRVSLAGEKPHAA